MFSSFAHGHWLTLSSIFFVHGNEGLFGSGVPPIRISISATRFFTGRVISTPGHVFKAKCKQTFGLDLDASGNNWVLGDQLDLVGVEPHRRPVLRDVDAFSLQVDCKYRNFARVSRNFPPLAATESGRNSAESAAGLGHVNPGWSLSFSKWDVIDWSESGESFAEIPTKHSAEWRLVKQRGQPGAFITRSFGHAVFGEWARCAQFRQC